MANMIVYFKDASYILIGLFIDSMQRDFYL